MNESPRTWVLPEETVAVRLMGTIWADTDGLHDDLDTRFGLNTWMEDAVGIHHIDMLASPEELAEARALRDSLRCLAAHQTDDTRPAAVSRADVAWSVDVVNTAAARLPAAQLRIENNTFHRTTPNPAVPAALAGVATEAVDLFGGSDADKLRACQAPAASSTSSKLTPAANGALSPAATEHAPHATTTEGDTPGQNPERTDPPDHYLAGIVRFW